MVVTIDLSYMPDRLRSIIQKSIDQKCHPDQNEGIIILQNESNTGKVKSMLEEILKENTIQDFVVTENTEKENEIALLKKGDLEQLGIYLCTHLRSCVRERDSTNRASTNTLFWLTFCFFLVLVEKHE